MDSSVARPNGVKSVESGLLQAPKLHMLTKIAGELDVCDLVELTGDGQAIPIALTRRFRARADERDRGASGDGEVTQVSTAVRGRVLLTHDPVGDRFAWELLGD